MLTFEGAQKYSDENVRHCKEILSFLKRKQLVTSEYSKGLQKVASNLKNPKTGNTPDLKTASENTNISKVFQEVSESIISTAEVNRQFSVDLNSKIIESFTSYLKEVDILRRTCQDKIAEYNKHLQDAITCMKKAQKEHDVAQNACLELQTAVSRAKKSEMKEKDFEKLTIKLNLATKKLNHAEETLRVHEEIVRNAQDHLHNQIKPKLNQELKGEEEDRAEYTKVVLQEYILMERQALEIQLGFVDALCDKIAAIDVVEDVENFVATYLNDDNDNEENLTVRALINPAKSGRLLVKNGDSASGWKTNYVVLMPEGKVYIYDREDALKPREKLELQACSVYFIHESFFDRPYCFRIVVDGTKCSDFDPRTLTNDSTAKKDLKTSFNFGAESEQDRESWIQYLRYFLTCCAKCEVMYGSSWIKAFSNCESDSSGFEIINEQYREIRSIKITVVEAKEIAALPSVKTLNSYAQIIFDEVKCGRTGIKSGDCPLWGEEFEFDDIDNHHNRLRVLIFHSTGINNQQNDIDIGYATINMAKLSLSKSVEEWYPVKIFQRPGVEITACSMRLIIESRHEYILPMAKYTGFIKGLMRHGLRAICLLSNNLGTKKNELANLIINIASANNKDIEVMKSLLDYDISKTEDPNIVFRGNTIATKALDKYMKIIGTEYLHSTIGPLIRTIARSKDSCEVDPMRIESAEVRKKNAKRLLNFVSLIWDAIFKSAAVVPPELVSIFSFMRQVLIKKFPGKNVHYAGISGFLFLRFFCPAILGPKLFGILNEHPDGSVARTLTLTAKIMQNLANLSVFGNKEPHMVEFNTYITENIPYMQIFLDKLSTNPNIYIEMTAHKSKMVLRRSAEALFRLFENNSQYMSENKDEIPTDDFEAYSNAMIELGKAHSEFQEKYATFMPRRVNTAVSKPASDEGESGSLERIPESTVDEVHSDYVQSEISDSSLPPMTFGNTAARRLSAVVDIQNRIKSIQMSPLPVATFQKQSIVQSGHNDVNNLGGNSIDFLQQYYAGATSNRESFPPLSVEKLHAVNSVNFQNSSDGQNMHTRQSSEPASSPSFGAKKLPECSSLGALLDSGSPTTLSGPKRPESHFYHSNHNLNSEKHVLNRMTLHSKIKSAANSVGVNLHRLSKLDITSKSKSKSGSLDLIQLMYSEGYEGVHDKALENDKVTDSGIPTGVQGPARDKNFSSRKTVSEPINELKSGSSKVDVKPEVSEQGKNYKSRLATFFKT